jgi:hypothetical protein
VHGKPNISDLIKRSWGISCNVHKSLKLVEGEGFDEIVVDASSVSLLLEASGGNTSYGHDAGGRDAPFAFVFADLARRNEAVHYWHRDIHQDKVVVKLGGFVFLQCDEAVVCRVVGAVYFAQEGGHDLGLELATF